MNWLGQRKDSESYRRWKKKYYSGRKIYSNNIEMRKRKTGSTSIRGRRPLNVPDPIRMNSRIRQLEMGAKGKPFKYFDYYLSNNVGTTPDIECISEIAQGDDDGERIGNEIRLHSIEFRLKITGDSATLGSTNGLRIALVMDTEGQGDYPGWGDVYKVSSRITTPRTVSGLKRFKILWDKMIVLNILDDGEDNSTTRKYYKRFGKFAPKLQYLGDTAVEASQGNNALYFMMVSLDETNQYYVQGDIRLRYTD